MAWTLRFSDAFTNTEFTSLPTHDATWTNHYNTNRIAAGGTTVGSVSDSRSSLSTSLANKQAVQFKYVSGDGAGALLRFADSGASFWGFTGYWIYYQSTGTIYLFRGDNDGGGDTLGTRTVTLSAGDILRMEADGSSLSIWVNGAQQGASITDTGYASGRAGLYKETTTDGYGDDFAAYDDAGTGTDISPGLGALTLAGLVASMNYTLNMPDEA